MNQFFNFYNLWPVANKSHHTSTKIFYFSFIYLFAHRIVSTDVLAQRRTSNFQRREAATFQWVKHRSIQIARMRKSWDVIGRLISPEIVSSRLQKILNAVNVKRFRFYEARGPEPLLLGLNGKLRISGIPPTAYQQHVGHSILARSKIFRGNLVPFTWRDSGMRTHLSMDIAHNDRMLAVQRRTSRETHESQSTSPNSQVPPVSFVKFILLGISFEIRVLVNGCLNVQEFAINVSRTIYAYSDDIASWMGNLLADFWRIFLM